MSLFIHLLNFKYFYHESANEKCDQIIRVGTLFVKKHCQQASFFEEDFPLAYLT